MIATDSRRIEGKLNALTALVDNNRFRFEDLPNNGGCIFGRIDLTQIGVLVGVPTYMIYTKAEHDELHPVEVAGFRRLYAGYREFAHRGETYSIYSDFLPR